MLNEILSYHNFTQFQTHQPKSNDRHLKRPKCFCAFRSDQKKKQISYLSSISFFEQKGESECKLFLLNLQVQKDFCILFSYV